MDCHPDEASNASGRTWLLASGQLRASEAGSGFVIAQRPFLFCNPLDDFLLVSGYNCAMRHLNSFHLAAIAVVGWLLMMPPDSSKIPHAVDSDTPISRWIAVTSYDTEDNCEKALTDIQNSEQDPITLDKTGKLARLNKHDAALGKARAVNAACLASDDIRLKQKK